MKLLLDQGLPRSAASLLREQGLDVVHTGEIGYATAEDGQILKLARDEKRIVVTLDADFHSLLVLSGAPSPSVIRIRIEGLRAAELVRLLNSILDKWSSALESCVLMSIQPDRVRIHYLPVA